jgi:rRNA maturation protein Nop10
LAKCPKCGQKMRVPVNKGKIEVTCPKCTEKFGVNT